MLLVLAAYYFRSVHNADGWLYHAINIVGAVVLIGYGVLTFAWANVALNLVWLLIGAFAWSRQNLTTRPTTVTVAYHNKAWSVPRIAHGWELYGKLEVPKGHDLYLEHPYDGDDTRVLLDDSLTVPDGARFYSAPLVINGG